MNWLNTLVKTLEGHPAESDATSDDRRVSPRYETLPNHGHLAWWEDGHPVDIEIHVQNLGMQGALVEAEKLPPAEKPLWLRLDEPTATEWAEAEFCRVAGPCQIGLRFMDACPFDLFKAARGITSESRNSVADSPQFNSRDWR